MTEAITEAMAEIAVLMPTYARVTKEWKLRAGKN
jgi:hypothetical protein